MIPAVHGILNGEDLPPAIPSIALLHFEGVNNSTVFADDSTATLPGTTPRQPTFGGSVSLSTASPITGSSSAVFASGGWIGYERTLIPGRNFTLELAFKYTQYPPNSSYYPILATSYNFPLQNQTWLLRLTPSNHLRFDFAGTGFILSNSPLNIDTVYRVAVVVRYLAPNDPGNNATLYVDGIAQATLQGNVGSGAYIYLGGSPGDNNIGNDWFVGEMDEFRVTEQVLYTGNYTPLTVPFPNA